VAGVDHNRPRLAERDRRYRQKAGKKGKWNETAKIHQKNNKQFLVFRGVRGRTVGQLRRGTALGLGDWDVKHSATHRDSSIGPVPQTRTRFCFQKSRVRQKFAIPADVGISPTSGRDAMKNMELIGAVDLGLGLVVRDDPA
jgi:hypothetical protein